MNGRESVKKYCEEVRELGLRIEEYIGESLGLEKDYIKNVLGDQGQHMAVNYYPACPQPELTYGLPGHTDPNALTILLQDLHVSGLQVLKDGNWLAVKPQPNAFVINIGDQLQVSQYHTHILIQQLTISFSIITLGIHKYCHPNTTLNFVLLHLALLIACVHAVFGGASWSTPMWVLCVWVLAHV